MILDLARHILTSMRCGVVTVDRSGAVTSLNDQAAVWLDVDPSGAIGRECQGVFAHCPAVARLLLDALQRSTLPDRAELDLEVGGKRRTLIGFSLSRITGDDGETLGSAIFFKDLTLVEEERGREALRNRLASLGEVAAQLAHEIRNRLGGIQLFLGLARRRLDGDGEGQGYLERAGDEIREANAKMGQILDFVRPLKLDAAPADPEALCRESLEATLARFPAQGPRVEWFVDSGLPRVVVDAAQVRDALANLFANAIEAAGPAGLIRIELSREQASVAVEALVEGAIQGLRSYGEGRGARVRIDITDDGPGMAPEVLRRIFHPFFTTKDQGSGLGVPTAQKILDAHAGSLDVASKPGRGATFIVRMPAENSEEEDGG
jgi:signal transduction histidine kinase